MTLACSLADLGQSPAFDVVVLGGGAAGLAAAVFAALNGQRVLLVERTGQVGGTSALSAGTAWVPNTRHAAEVGAQDSVEQAALFLDHAVGNRSPRAMRDVFLREGPAAIDTLENRAGVPFQARPFHPDYLSELDGAVSCGRAIETLPFDGRRLGSDLDLIRPTIPEFTILGGLMVDRDDIAHLLNVRRSLRSAAQVARLVGGHVLERLYRRRSTRLTMGNALIGRLLLAARERGVRLLLETEVMGIGGPEGGVDRVTVEQHGARAEIAVSGGVVLASGGFALHPERRRQMLPEPVPEYSPAAPTATGRLHDIALRLGARYGEGASENVFWAPVSRRRRKDGSVAVFPHFVFDRAKPGTVCVGRDGRRFVNESTSYHQFVRAMYAANRDGSTIPAFLITDASGMKRYGLGMVRPGGFGLRARLKDGYVVRGQTLRELAGRAGIDPGGLAATVMRINGYARSGVDPEFARGTTVYERANGDPGHGGPNPTLGPIATPPFYAVELWPGDIGAATGLVCDEDARVLGPDGPIRGLYACGADMHSIMGGIYPAPGITIGPALAFAYIAARHAAGRGRGEER
ncbi:MAG TPA: FAD-dependent oxidoreductase [Geminicoccaceae bacterium]